MSAVTASANSSFRPLHPGMGQAVAERTVLRKVLKEEVQWSTIYNGEGSLIVGMKDPDRGHMVRVCQEHGVPVKVERNVTTSWGEVLRWETWGEVANRVAVGNVSLLEHYRRDVANATKFSEIGSFRRHIANGTILMSGRHIQHGDLDQYKRPAEVFTNCATAATTFLLFYLLLNGSGVGRCYDDDMIIVNWDHAPNIRCVIDETHPDYDYKVHEPLRDARHKYGTGERVHWFKVPDDREGWAKALNKLEVMAYEKIYKDDILILDFSAVRASGEPIMGMQGRPSSGPAPLMAAFAEAATIKGSGLKPWLQALYMDHIFAKPVLVGGARRAARMATKTWRDATVFDFIGIKRPIEYDGFTAEEVAITRKSYQDSGRFAPMAFLWSSNNSVTVDAEFWKRLSYKEDHPGYNDKLTRHARKVFETLTAYAYGDGTGEPGIINVDMLVQNNEGLDTFRRGEFAGSSRYQMDEETTNLLTALARRALAKKNQMITNPCGEIALHILGGYCVLSDVVPFHADTLEEAEDAFRHATRSLMRVNLMESLYDKEVKRTNRIGVSVTGIHEFAWKFFSVGFRDLINPDFDVPSDYDEDADDLTPRQRAGRFWLTMQRFSKAIKEEARTYAAVLGVNVPHTDITCKPAGTTSKLFGLCEGWHLPAMGHYVRWVQFQKNDPLVSAYREQGYPIRDDLKSYRDQVIVGFPTEPTIASFDMGDALVMAGDATPEEQYRWVSLGEHFFLSGGSPEELGKPVPGDTGNQISYTLKYKPDIVSLEDFRKTVMEYQPKVKACSVMPQEEGSAYEYLPESPVTKAEYEAILRGIGNQLTEDIGKEHIDCASGSCPIDFRGNNGDA